MTHINKIVKWPNFSGFQGSECSCGATHNLLADIPGFICKKCGRHNCLPFSGSRRPHENPDYGWSQNEIKEAFEKRDKETLSENI